MYSANLKIVELEVPIISGFNKNGLIAREIGGTNKYLTALISSYNTSRWKFSEIFLVTNEHENEIQAGSIVIHENELKTVSSRRGNLLVGPKLKLIPSKDCDLIVARSIVHNLPVISVQLLHIIISLELKELEVFVDGDTSIMDMMIDEHCNLILESLVNNEEITERMVGFNKIEESKIDEQSN